MGFAGKRVGQCGGEVVGSRVNVEKDGRMEGFMNIDQTLHAVLQLNTTRRRKDLSFLRRRQPLR
jgi:hypothetical protein